MFQSSGVIKSGIYRSFSYLVIKVCRGFCSVRVDDSDEGRQVQEGQIRLHATVREGSSPLSSGHKESGSSNIKTKHLISFHSSIYNQAQNFWQKIDMENCRILFKKRNNAVYYTIIPRTVTVHIKTPWGSKIYKIGAFCFNWADEQRYSSADVIGTAAPNF